MILLFTILFILPSILQGNFVKKSFLEFMQKRLCDSVRLEGPISDCNCDFSSVDSSVKKFFLPALKEITSRTFFRYFRVSLDERCPFWQEDGECMMESCSVCTCDDNEVPRSWVDESKRLKSDHETNSYNYGSGENFGWISSTSSAFDTAGNGQSKALDRQYTSSPAQKTSSQITRDEAYLKYLRDTEDDDNGWTDMSEDSIRSKLKPSPSYGTGIGQSSYKSFDRRTPSYLCDTGSSNDLYVNLLDNPEQYTGYSGPSAARVWQAIQHENCFGGLDDTCVEKRVFYRLMSGLQASISTHIAQQYFYADGRSGTNIPLFVRAVGSHPDRMSNLYFTFLFVLRAVTKAGSVLTDYPFHTGQTNDDRMVRNLIRTLVDHRLLLASGDSFNEVSTERTRGFQNADWNKNKNELEQCRKGFDESVLFQVHPSLLHGASQHSQGIQEKQQLREEFRNRFRNITRIMDCVTCEKCKVWGKLQILGLGTAIKILLTPEIDLKTSKGFLNRQELIALINTFHQLAKSVSFASDAADLELSSKIHLNHDLFNPALWLIAIILLVLYVIPFRRRRSVIFVGKVSTDDV